MTQTMTQAFLPFPAGCMQGRFVRREKRFTVWLDAGDGSRVAVHSNNSGSMLGLLRPGMRVLASPADRPGRKLLWTQEAVRLPDFGGDFWVGVNTSVPNRMVEVAFRAGALPQTSGFTEIKRECRRGQSRIDALCTGPDVPPLWIECKNVTMVEDGVAMFPDAASERARKHVGELMELVAQGQRAALFCLIQRPDAHCFGPADVIDPAFATLFWQAVAAGVEVWPFVADVSMEGVRLGRQLPLVAHSL